MATNSPPVLEAVDVYKHFGAVVALKRGSFDVHEGEVHAIVGDNGAGKSTLLKIIAGAHQPDGGQLLMDGHPVHPANPRAAQELGIATVFQDLGVIDHLNATENLFLGREIYRRPPLSWVGVLDRGAMRRQAIADVNRLKVNVKSVDQPLLGMSGGQRQAVAVARAAAFGSRVVIMDEPTAALGVRETAAVLDLIRQLRSEGLAVVLISHSMPDVFAVADRVTVLRLGETVATLTIAQTDRETVIGAMTGAFAPTA